MCSLSIPNCNALFCLLFQKPRDRVGKRSTITAEVSSTTSSLGKWLWINFDAQRRFIPQINCCEKCVDFRQFQKYFVGAVFEVVKAKRSQWIKNSNQLISHNNQLKVGIYFGGHQNWSKAIFLMTRVPLLICTWFLKNQVVKIQFDKLDF